MFLAKLSFPGLGIGEFNLDPIAIPLSENFGIAWYALIITCGMIFAVSYVIYRSRRIGINSDLIIDYAIFVIPLGVLGARLYYVFMKIEDFHSLGEVLDIRSGGLAIYGGIIAGTLTVFVISKIKKISFAALGDCVVPGLIMAQAIGRWGNFVNIEAYGSTTTLPWRMCAPSIANELSSKGLIDSAQYAQILSGELGVHPTFLYESLWNVIGFVLINIFYKHKKYDGQAILLVFGWYGLGRLLIEGLRTDSLYLFGSGIRVSQALAGLILLTCISLLIYFKVKPPKKKAFYYVNTKESSKVGKK